MKSSHIEDVRAYYDSDAAGEWERLNHYYAKIEFQSTVHLINKYFKGHGRVLDIGSGPGRYSKELIEKGYTVELLDLSIEELKLAETMMHASGLKADAYHCLSATELDGFASEFYDHLLILGPMYHLHEARDRQKVYGDAYRLLKPGGIALVAYVNTWGALKASVYEFPESFEDIEHIDRYLAGNLKFSKDESFTATFFTTPSHAQDEIKKTDFEIISYAGAESFLSGLHLPLKALKSERPLIYDNYLKRAATSCELPQYRDATEHVIFVLKKPE